MMKEGQRMHPARSKKYSGIQIGIPKGFAHDIYDYGKSRYVSQSEIKEIEKREDKTFASDKELDQEADKNMRYKKEKESKQLSHELRTDLKRVFR